MTTPASAWLDYSKGLRVLGIEIDPRELKEPIHVLDATTSASASLSKAQEQIQQHRVFCLFCLWSAAGLGGGGRRSVARMEPGTRGRCNQSTTNDQAPDVRSGQFRSSAEARTAGSMK